MDINHLLCSCCLLFLTTPREIREKGVDHHPSAQALQASADKGCPICIHFWDLLTNSNDAKVNENLKSGMDCSFEWRCPYKADDTCLFYLVYPQVCPQESRVDLLCHFKFIPVDGKFYPFFLEIFSWLYLLLSQPLYTVWFAKSVSLMKLLNILVYVLTLERQ